ncbi:MAG: hypothetical protein ACLPND_21180 [Candidatus Korobacteraceae bacterium]
MPETDTPINLIPNRRHALDRTADACLRAMGGGRITLRIPDPSAGDTNSQLGITPPTAEDIQIAPAVVQPMPAAPDGTRRWQVMFSARALRAAAEPYGVTDIANWLLTSQGVFYRGRLLPIRSVISNSFADGDYLYLVVATE